MIFLLKYYESAHRGICLDAIRRYVFGEDVTPRHLENYIREMDGKKCTRQKALSICTLSIVIDSIDANFP